MRSSIDDRGNERVKRHGAGPKNEDTERECAFGLLRAQFITCPLIRADG